MVVLYPILLIGAAYLMAKSRERGLGARGRIWFAAWVGAGAFFAFSLITGLSIGLLFLPAVAIAVCWLAVHAPYWREAAGFPIGGAVTVAGLLFFI